MNSVIAVVAPDPFVTDRLVSSFELDGSAISELDPKEPDFPPDATGLLIYAPNDAARETDVETIVSAAMEAGIPILGSALGMHQLNVALGGDIASPTPEHVADETSKRNRKSIFLAPGAKVSSTIGGSGWLSLQCNHPKGIRQSGLAPGLMPSAMCDDRVVEAFELPGFHWIFGVQWDIFGATRLPRGFDNVLIAFVERATGK